MTLAIIGTGGHAKSIYDIVKNKKDDSIEALCDKVLYNKETFLE